MHSAKANLDARGSGPCATDGRVARRALKAMGWDFTGVAAVAFCTLNRCK